MATFFNYDPRIGDLLEKFDLKDEDRFTIIALFEKRDRDLEDYLSQQVSAVIDSRLAILEAANTAKTIQINSLIATIGPGLIIPYGADPAIVIPTGWVKCDGAAISRATFAALFTVIGITYGAGNGTTTFNVPDLTGRFPLGKTAAGTGSTLGGTGGAIDHTHGTVTNVAVTGATTVGGTTAANPPFIALNYLIKT